MTLLISKLCSYQIILMAALTECTLQSLFLTNLPATSSVYNPEATHSESAMKLVSKIAISMASVYDVVFHYDNMTETFVDAICTETGQYNYSKINEDGLPRSNKFHYETQNVVYIMNRFQGDYTNGSWKDYNHTRKILHIVILPDPLNFTSIVLKSLRNVKFVLYVCINQSENTKSCKNQYDRSVGSNFSSLNPSKFFNTTVLLRRLYLVMVLEFTEYLARLFEICYYCGTYAQKMILKYETKLENQMVQELVTFMRYKVEYNYKDYHGHIFRVAFPDGNIYIGCSGQVNTIVGNDVLTECDEILGIEAIMLKEMSERMNFSFFLVNSKKRVPGGLWKNMLKNVYESTADFAIGSILFSKSRLEKYDFSIGVGDDPLRIVYMNRPHILSECEFFFVNHSFKPCIIFDTIQKSHCTLHSTVFRFFKPSLD